MPAPVEYAPRDFVLHLFSAFCQMTLRHPAPGRRRRLGPGQVAVLLAGLAHTRLAWRAISAARRGRRLKAYGLPDNQVRALEGVVSVAVMMYEHPLAYVLGLEGVALMRAYTGGHDRAFVEARLAEIRAFLDDERLAGAAVEVERVDVATGYRIWASTYDGPNSAFDLDEPFIKEVVGGLPAGDALDAACGTGRIAALLAARGHRVRGVDGSPDMLARARERVPDAEFLPGELAALPLPDACVDLVVCSLALTHVPALDPVLAEFARVLRPGGHAVLSDIHPDGVARGVVPPVRLPGGRPARVATHHHPVGDYVRAALAAGLHVRRCEEPRHPAGEPRERTDVLEPWDVWPWALCDLAPEAAHAAIAGTPSMLFWHFQR